MLFDLKPKETPSELFGREEDLSRLIDMLQANNWVVVIGPRMVGKTSLIKAANMRLDIKYQTLYVNLWGTGGIQGLLGALANALNSTKGIGERVKEFVGGIEGLTIGPGGISVTSPRRPLTSVWTLLNLIGREAGKKKVIIELDEVQEISAVSGQFLKILANIWNTYRNVEFIFSGSMFGLIRTLLNPRSSKNPMYGRPPAELVLGRFDKKTAEAFLNSGFKECGTRVPDRMGTIIENHLDGIPGWLTLYGNCVGVRGQSSERALKTTMKEGKNVVRNELQNFLEGRERILYISALRAMTGGGASWSTVKKFIEAGRRQAVAGSTVENVLKSLRDGFLIEREEGTYRIIDPILRSFLVSGARV